MKLRWLIIFVWAGILWSCGKDYDFSGQCHRMDGIKSSGLYSKSDRVAIEGLHCIYYEVAGPSTVHIDISQLPAGCGDAIGGTVTADGNNLFRIALEEKDCDKLYESGCGLCPYDFSFDVSDVDPTKEMVITVSMDPCHDDTRCVAEQTFPLATAPRGVACTYNDVLGPTGNMPCSDDDECASPTDDYACAPPAPEKPSDKRCLKKCEEDPDCGADGIYRCEQNVCALANPLTPCNT